MTRKPLFGGRMQAVAATIALLFLGTACSSTRRDARPDVRPAPRPTRPHAHTPPHSRPTRVQPAPSPRKPIVHQHVSLDECKTRAIEYARAQGLLYREYETRAWRAEDNTVRVTIIRTPRQQGIQRTVVLDDRGQVLRVLEGASRRR